tara:strand:- start:102 stop:917 length:816 start_codon:yes stop_codon:yes gene_type:complete
MKKLEKQHDPVFGLKCLESLAKYDQDTHSLKMFQCSLFEEESESLQILPKSGMMRRGLLYRLPMLERGTTANVSGLWRTPDANMERGTRTYNNMKARLERKMPINLNDQLNAIDKGLLEEPKMFPTPSQGMWKQDVKDSGQYARSIQKKGHQIMLPAAVKLKKMFPTPDTMIATGGEYKDIEKIKARKAKGKQLYLADEVKLREAMKEPKMFPTPTANEDAAGKPTGKMQRMLGNCQEVRNTGTGTLNPNWVEWLMGYPIGWTDLKDSETQ